MLAASTAAAVASGTTSATTGEPERSAADCADSLGLHQPGVLTAVWRTDAVGPVDTTTFEAAIVAAVASELGFGNDALEFTVHNRRYGVDHLLDLPTLESDHDITGGGPQDFDIAVGTISVDDAQPGDVDVVLVADAPDAPQPAAQLGMVIASGNPLAECVGLAVTALDESGSLDRLAQQRLGDDQLSVVTDLDPFRYLGGR